MFILTYLSSISFIILYLTNCATCHSSWFMQQIFPRWHLVFQNTSFDLHLQNLLSHFPLQLQEWHLPWSFPLCNRFNGFSGIPCQPKNTSSRPQCLGLLMIPWREVIFCLAYEWSIGPSACAHLTCQLLITSITTTMIFFQFISCRCESYLPDEMVTMFLW